MKMDAEANKVVLDKMLKTLKSDNEWDPDDPYENACIAGGLLRYHFGLASSAVATSFDQQQKDSTLVQSDAMKVQGLQALENKDVDLTICVKTEHPEEPQVLEKSKELVKLEKELSSTVAALRKNKAFMQACKKPEGHHTSLFCDHFKCI